MMCYSKKSSLLLKPPHPHTHTTKLSGGKLVSPCPSVLPAYPVSALYHLQFWLDPFHIYTSYQTTSEGVSPVKLVATLNNLNFGNIFQICNFDFVFFWLGIWYESLVWVIMRRQGISQNAGVLVLFYFQGECKCGLATFCTETDIVLLLFSWLKRISNN